MKKNVGRKKDTTREAINKINVIVNNKEKLVLIPKKLNDEISSGQKSRTMDAILI